MTRAKTQKSQLRKQLAKAPTGIQGLDEIIFGELPQGRPTLVCGSAGCGKTLLAMEFLVHGATQFIKKICEENLQGHYDLDVIDLYQQPQLAQGEQIIALPTLTRKLAAPLRRFIGDISNTERALVGLDIPSRA